MRLVRKFWPRKWRWRLALLGLLLMVGSAVSVEVTSQPKFCDSCHIMGTYFESWTTSSHRNVSCVECHIAPGTANFVHAKLNGLGQVVDDVLNRSSTKPSASVSDFSCTRSGCHVIGELGEIEKEGRSYKFNHDKHLSLHYDGIGMHCTTCHSHVMGQNHFEVNTSVCITCHLSNYGGDTTFAARPADDATVESAAAPGDSDAAKPNDQIAQFTPAPTNCDACHNPPDKTITYQGLTIDHGEFLRFGANCQSCHRNATETAKRVESVQCYKCHDFGMERFSKVAEMHTVHTEGRHKVECLDCHGMLRHGPDAQALSLEQFDCQACHAGQHRIQRSAYGNGTHAASPHGNQPISGGGAVSPMFLVHVDCTGCHIQPSALSVKPTSGATVNKAVATACDNCHRAGLGEQMVPMWQRSTREMYDSVLALMPADPPMNGSESASLIEEARQLLELVRVDGSWGVHNPKYTQSLLEQAREKILKAKGNGIADSPDDHR